MYAIYADGELMFQTGVEDEAYIVLEPDLTLDINAAGSLSFVMPPGNKLHGKLKKLKTIITMEQDGEIIFRGRVVEDEKDNYNQYSVYCEGDKSFLLDSQQEPYNYNGTAHGLFSKLIANHNARVEAKKRFTVGTVDAVSASETVTVENTGYADTSSEIENKLLGAYGGYLRSRTVGNTHYLDWVKEYGETNAQAIEFAVNLLDLKDKISAKDVFTVLIPLGAAKVNDDGEYDAPLTIESVNNGSKYLQDNAAVALFGHIERTQTWGHVEEPSLLLEKGRQYMKTGIALQTLTLKAVDMHFVDGNIERIKLGDKVHILSEPHGIDLTIACSKMNVDPLNPESTSYTFGEKPRTLTDNVVNNNEDLESVNGRGGGGGRGNIMQEVSEILRWAKINVNEAEGKIELLTGEKYEDIDEGIFTLKQANILLNGAEGSIGLVASVEDNTERLSKAEINIDGANAQIALRVEKDGVISSINASPEDITIKASRINLEGYVTASTLSAEIASINNFFSGNAQAAWLKAYMLDVATSCKIYGNTLQCTSGNFVTSVTMPTLRFTEINYRGSDGNPYTLKVCTGYEDAGSASRTSRNYVSWYT